MPRFAARDGFKMVAYLFPCAFEPRDLPANAGGANTRVGPRDRDRLGASADGKSGPAHEVYTKIHKSNELKGE